MSGLDRYELGEVVAVQWNPALAAEFPDAKHTHCRQAMWHDSDSWRPYNPPRCVGYHCPKCGAPVNSYGHHA